MTDHQPDLATRKHQNRPFAIALIILVLLFLAGLAGLAVWMTLEMGEFNPQAILSRITGNEVSLQLTDMLNTGTGQDLTEEPTPDPTPEVILSTPTPELTPVPTTEVAVATTQVPASTETGTTEEGSATETAPGETITTTVTEASPETTSQTAEGTPGTTVDPASTTAPSELPDTGFMDEMGLPMLAAFGAVLFLVILLIKRIRMSL